jgi:hypothetical protein
MRVLLVGEYSGVHLALAKGLRTLGHDVTVVSGGDGWKGFASDFSLNSSLSGILGKIDRNIVRPVVTMGRAFVARYDVVQFMAPVALLPGRGRVPLNRAFYLSLMRASKRSFLLAAGDDALTYQAGPRRMRYTPWPDHLSIDLEGTSSIWSDPDIERWNRELGHRVSGVIPVMYDYAVGYEGFATKRPTIPLPIDVDAVTFQPNIVGKRLVVYHGVTRAGFKGSRHVIEGFDRLARKYPSDIEPIIADRMPIHEYLKVLERTNVVVDQVNSYSYGMNALYAMSLGKVVLSGCEPECVQELGFRSCPVVNVTPDADDVVQKIENLLDQRGNVEHLGRAARTFVEENHRHDKIAQRYLETWASSPEPG